MADQAPTETIGTALKLKSEPATVRAGILTTSPDFQANSVLTAQEKSGSREAVRVAARSEIPQNSIDSLKAQIKTSVVQTEFTGHVDRLKKFIEGGTLIPADQKLLVDEIQKVINQYQPLRDALGHTHNIEAYAKWLLATQGGTLTPEIYQRLGELLKSQPPVSETDLQRLKGEVDTKKAEREIVASDRDDAEKQRKAHRATVDSFTGGAKQVELAAARTGKPAEEAKLATKESDISAKEKEIKDLQEARDFLVKRGLTTFRSIPEIDADIAAADVAIAKETNPYNRDALSKQKSIYLQERTLCAKHPGASQSDLDSNITASESGLKTLKSDKAKIEHEIGKTERLEQEFQQAQEELKKANRALLEAQAKLTAGDSGVASAESAYNDAKRQYEAWEKDLANKAGGIMGESAASWINAEAQKLEQAFEAHFAELAKKEQEEPKRNLRNKVTELISDEKTKRVKGQRVSYRETSKSKVFTHAQTLLNEGPDKLIADFCGKAGITDAAEIAKMQSDPVLRNDIITEVLGGHMIANGLLPQQVKQIEQSDWGKGMVTKSIEQNDRVKAEIEKAFGAGALNSPSFLKKFWYTANKHPWLLLLVLGGVVAGGIAVGPLGAGLGFGMASAGVGAAAHATAVGAGASQMDTLEQLGM